MRVKLKPNKNNQRSDFHYVCIITTLLYYLVVLSIGGGGVEF